MRVLMRLLLMVVVLALVLPLVVVLASLESEPAVVAAEELTQADIERAKALVKANDPRRLEAGEIRSIGLSEKELNLVLRYGLGRLLPVTARVALEDGRAVTEATATVPDNPLGRYLNLAATVVLEAGRPRLADTRIGHLPLPDAVANLLLEAGHRLLGRHDLYHRTLEAINGVRVSPERLLVVYQWQPGLMDEARSAGRRLLLQAGEDRRLLAYHRELARLAEAQPQAVRPDLTALLPPLFRLAEERSQGGDPVAENRSLITVLALHVQGVSVPRLLEAADEPAVGRLVPLLRGRRDLAQHFLISAGVTVVGGGGLADAVGLLKEVDDSRHGSGFSFTDLAADRAGVRFAERATAGAAAARRVQAQVAAGLAAGELLPSLAGLDEYMSEAVFERRYGGVGSPAYEKVVRDIEHRLSALALYAD